MRQTRVTGVAVLMAANELGVFDDASRAQIREDLWAELLGRPAGQVATRRSAEDFKAGRRRQTTVRPADTPS